MRHALIPIQLMHEARGFGSAVFPERSLHDAPPEPEAAVAVRARPRRLATLIRRARALVVRPT